IVLGLEGADRVGEGALAGLLGLLRRVPRALGRVEREQRGPRGRLRGVLAPARLAEAKDLGLGGLLLSEHGRARLLHGAGSILSGRALALEDASRPRL